VSRSSAKDPVVVAHYQRQLFDAARRQFDQFLRHYRLTDRAGSELLTSLNREIRRSLPSEFSQVVTVKAGARRRSVPLSPAEKVSLYRARQQVTARDLLRAQLDSGAELSDEMTRALGLTTAELSRQLGPTTAADLAKRAQFEHSASLVTLSRRDREAARHVARRIELCGFPAREGRPRYAGETTVLEIAFAIRDALARSGRIRLSDRRIIPFSKVGSSLKGRAVDLLRAAVLAALPVTGLPSDRYLEEILTRRLR